MRYPRISAEEEIQIARRWRDGNDARALSRLVEGNMGLVEAMSARFLGRGVDRDDLIQEGNLGLLEAARRFEPERGFRLATYAKWWIVQFMRSAIMRARGRQVRYGSTRGEQMVFERLGRAKQYLITLGREVTRGALAEVIGVDIVTFDQAIERLYSSDLPLNADSRTSAGGTLPLSERLAAEGPTLEDEMASREEDAARGAWLRDFAERLPPRKRQVFKARHLGDRPTHYAEIGRELGVSKQRVKQIDEQCIRKAKRDAKQKGDL